VGSNTRQQPLQFLLSINIRKLFISESWQEDCFVLTIDFLDRNIIHFGLDTANVFNAVVRYITPIRHVYISVTFYSVYINGGIYFVNNIVSNEREQEEGLSYRSLCNRIQLNSKNVMVFHFLEKCLNHPVARITTIIRPVVVNKLGRIEKRRWITSKTLCWYNIG